MADDDSSNDGRIDRRKFLGGLGAGAAAGLAGCGGDGGTATPGDTPTETATTGDGGDGMDTPTETEEPTPTQEGGPQPGGTPTIGMAVAPSTLNPYAAGSVYSFFIIDRVMGAGGTVTHPRTSPSSRGSSRTGR